MNWFDSGKKTPHERVPQSKDSLRPGRGRAVEVTSSRPREGGDQGDQKRHTPVLESIISRSSLIVWKPRWLVSLGGKNCNEILGNDCSFSWWWVVNFIWVCARNNSLSWSDTRNGNYCVKVWRTELNRGFPIQSLRNDVRDVTNLNPQHIHEQAWLLTLTTIAS